MKKVILIITMCFLLAFSVAGCRKQVFNGNRSSNDTQFVMDYSILNRTETHEMELKENSIIDVSVDNKAGSLDIVVISPIGEEIYRGDDASSGEFSINIDKQGVYKFSVKGSNSKGAFSFKVRK
jgi:hypothetical protein